MDITFLILFGLSVLAANAMIVGIERFANAVKDEFAKIEDKKMAQKTVTLDELLNERGNFVKQVVYKIDGDYVGDIKGENVTVILMGNGDFKGDINSKNGTVFLNKGNVIGDIKADKVLCPSVPNTHTQVDAKCSECEFVKRQRFISLHGNRECYKCNKFNESFDDDRSACQEFKYRNPAKDVKSPELPIKNVHKTCYDCVHLRFDLGLTVCNVTNESLYRFTPCENYERRHK